MSRVQVSQHEFSTNCDGHGIQPYFLLAKEV